jgi:hypothetical protein
MLNATVIQGLLLLLFNYPKNHNSYGENVLDIKCLLYSALQCLLES